MMAEFLGLVMALALFVGWSVFLAIGIGRACAMGDEIARAQEARRLEGGQP